MNVSIYGIGNFGYAFLKHLDNKNDGSYKLTAYDRNPSRVEYLKANHSHPFLHKDTKLSDNITFVDDTNQLLDNCDIVLLAVPSTATREVMRIIRSRITRPIIIINTAKSLDKDSGKGLSAIAEEELMGANYSYALLAGGTIAGDLFKHEPLGADIACKDPSSLPVLKELFQSGTLHINTTLDLIGVEYAAAFKNIVSILAGVINGMGLSYGAETHIISRTAQMIGDVCINKLGAMPSTFSIGSQSWGNDMWMSCTGNTRNREFGRLVGGGMSATHALEKMASANKLVEGVNTLRVITNVQDIYEIPLIKLLYEVTIQGSDVNIIRQYIHGSK